MRKLVTIHSSSSYPEAFMIKSQLEANGIFCAIADEHMVTMYGLIPAFLGGIKVQVRDVDVLLAKTLLNEAVPFSEESLSAEEATPLSHLKIAKEEPSREEASPLCPSCSSDNTRREHMHGWWTALDRWLARTFSIEMEKEEYRCFTCSHRWEV